MPGLAKLTNLASGGNIQEFICVNFESGWFKPTKENIVDEITAAGAKGTRMRIFRTDFRRFRMEAYSDHLGWLSATDAHDDSFKFKGSVCVFEITVQGITYVPLNKLMIWDVQAIPIAADVIAALTLTATPKAMVKYIFDCQFSAELA